MVHRLRVVAGLAAGLTLAAGAVQDATREDADRVWQKVQAIIVRAAAPPKSRNPPPLRTTFTEREINAYLKFLAKDQMPDGVRDLRLLVLDNDRLESRALVDLDAVRKSRERGLLDPLAYVGGVVEVKASGILTTARGRGTFVLESGTVGNLPVPKALLQELVAFYSRTPEQPRGISFDQPFDLPVAIREVQLRRGAATVIQ